MCGNENDDIARNCTNCGTKLSVNPELEMKPNTPKKTNYQPVIGANRQDNHTEKLGYQNQVLAETQNKMIAEILEGTKNTNKMLKSINGWVTFFGLITLIGLILGLIKGCGSFLGL